MRDSTLLRPERTPLIGCQLPVGQGFGVFVGNYYPFVRLRAGVSCVDLWCTLPNHMCDNGSVLCWDLELDGCDFRRERLGGGEVHVVLI